MKKTNKAAKFPNISRLITERVFKATKNKVAVASIYTVIYLAMLVVVVYLAINLYQNLKTYQNVSSEKTIITNQIKSWQSIIKTYPNFKDAYLQLAVLEYRLGDYEKSRIYCDKALFLDPEYSDAIELNKKLRGK